MQDTWMSPAELARIEEPRVARAVADLALAFEEVAGGTVSFGGAGSWINEGRGLALEGPITDEEVSRALRFFAEHGVVPRFDVCPHAHPSLLGGLAARGLVALGFEAVLYRRLARDASTASDANAAPSDVVIRPVGVGDRNVFIATVGRWLAATDDGEGAPLDDVAAGALQRVLAHPNVEAWLAYADGVPVGGGGLEVWPGRCPDGSAFAVLMMTAVAPSRRRRGVQGALMRRRLERARELGAGYAVVGSAPGVATERNAARLGFRVAYTKVTLGAR